MRKYAVPGGAVAVLRDGRLIYARGFGYADVESKRPVQPDALFRIASGLVAEMTGDGPVVCAGGACYYAFGWLVRPTRGDATWSHGGALPGTTSILVRPYHNFSWVALFNARSWTANFDSELNAALWNALASVTSFPDARPVFDLPVT